MALHQKPNRIVLVSNRLPITIRKTDTGLEFRSSVGGLATGLQSVQGDQEILWIGWPGTVAKEDRKEAEATLIQQHNYTPVFMSERLVEKFYEGFCNRTVWPLLHSFPMYTKYSAAEWEAYNEANMLFAERILKTARHDDIIWIHDYHLMLLPKLLRDHFPRASIGFFLHIPFPQYDILRLLPQSKEIVESLLSADLIGFHTHDYAQAFLGSVRRILGYDNALGQIMRGDRVVQVDVFPMGIDFDRYSHAAQDAAALQEVEKIHQRIGKRKIVFLVSRLDYTKGIPQSLDAIEEFFERYPQWRENVTFILVVVPSRERVERYASLKRQIDEQVGSIISAYATLDWAPIRYIYRNLDFPLLVALYEASDVALIIPLRDGMNLIAKEYLAVQNDCEGVLILSELAGAAKELLESVIVNPNNTEDVAAAIDRALTMPVDEQRRRNEIMRRRLQSYGLEQWVHAFLRRLTDVVTQSQSLSVKILNATTKKELLKEYAKAERRLLILDYDGTLVPFANEPGAAKPDKELFQILKALSDSSKNSVAILSGRDRHSLTAWFGSMNMVLAAEHGGWIKHSGSSDWHSTIAGSQDVWKEQVRPILQLYVDRIPGSFIEEKDFALVWHYRQADVESGSVAAKELLDTVSNLAANFGIHVLPGSKTVEVRNVSIGKGIFFNQQFAKENFPFMLVIGDDWTDEDLFGVLPQSAYSIRVGKSVSKARFNVETIADVRALLGELEKK
ncbi:MAG: bifunctional alpha,alpha-trehalose-phosphate synthase (UDP-forming)/trehalose-phosphatase [Bacteroidota bacterium]|nr:bifunctional alpha,alpha-trehalose-phosphate synthase (UDP-forming)/trehalose-phosphatase [Bacteroidota bacterium]